MKQCCSRASVQPSSVKGLAALLCALCAMGINSSTAQAGEPEPFDLALSFSFDVGSADMSKFGRGVDAFSAELTTLHPKLSSEGAVGGNRMLAVTPRARLYLPRLMYVETGFDYLRSTGSVGLDFGGLDALFSYTNFSVSMPVLFGVQMPEFYGMHFFGALGPALLLYNRSDWKYDRGQATDYKASGGGGFEVNLGGDYDIVSKISVHLALRYRFLQSNELKLIGEQLPPVPELGELEYSGLSVVMGLRWQLH